MYSLLSVSRHFRRTSLCALALLALLPAAGSAAPGPDSAGAARGDPIFGTWANPKRTVTVRIAPCGDGLCGTIVAATNEAKQDARRAGTDNLIGTALFRNYHRTDPGHWTGTLFVPDMGRTVSSRLVELSTTKLRVSGCLVGGILCKSQDWSRL